MKKISKQLLSILLTIAMVLTIAPVAVFAEDDVLSYLTYEIYNGEVTITGCDQSISGDIVIPDTIDSYPVTSIGFLAFDGCDNITSITIPECITFIDMNAFYECNGISNVYYGGNDAVWGWFADDIGLSESCTIHFAKDAELMNYFKYSIINDEVTITDCSTTISGDIAIPGIIEGYPVTKINQQAFYNCKRLTDLVIPDSVTIIDDAAFWYCEGLTNITIPKNVISIGECAFSNCSSLEQISVDKDNKYFSSDEFGVLFNKDKTELIQYPIGNNSATYSIPDSVTLIGFCSFQGCENLKNIIIGSNVKKIDSEAFENCSSLENVIIPESVTIINDFAFDGCDSISSMTLEGFTTYIGFYAFGYEYICEENDGVGSCFYGPIDGFVIYGIPNSASERYAKEYGFTFVSIAEDNYDEPSEEKELVVSDTCGNNLTWSLYSDGELIIEGTGDEYKFYRPTLASSWWFYREDIVSAKIKEGVTSIYTLSFRECTNLKSVYIPVSVEYIADDAFLNGPILDVIYYAGTQEEWYEIVGSEYLKDIDIVFNYNYADEPSVEESTTQEPTTEKPPIEDSTTQEPTTEKLSEEETTTQEPTTNDTTTSDVNSELVIKSDSDIDVNEDTKMVVIPEKSNSENIKNQVENEIVILGSEGNVLDDNEFISTGCKVQVLDNDGNVLSEYDVIVEYDVDGNGKISAADARLALRASAQLDNLSGVYVVAADYDGDGKLTAADARMILRKSAGLE